MKAAVYALLNGDATLGAALTGGLYQVPEISRQATPGAFDANSELLPCGLLKLEAQTQGRVFVRGSRVYLVVYLYERDGASGIEAARARIYDLLHDQQVVPTDGSTCWRIRHVNDVADTKEEALDARMAMSRYEGLVLR